MAYKKVEVNSNFWNPEVPEEFIEGTVQRIFEGEYGKQLTVRNEDGMEYTTPSHKVLQARIRDVKMGDKVKIVYTGTELPKFKGQNPTKMYDVYIDE